MTATWKREMFTLHFNKGTYLYTQELLHTHWVHAMVNVDIIRHVCELGVQLNFLLTC